MRRKSVIKAVVVLAVAAVWTGAAALLWHTSVVPGGLHISGLDEHDFFSAAELTRSSSFSRVETALQLAAIATTLVFLGTYAWLGRLFARAPEGDRVGVGILAGLLGIALLWVIQIPFGVVELWWQRRYGIGRMGYFEWLIANWFGLRGELLFVGVALLVVVGLASWLGERRWLVGAPFFVGLALLFTFLLPWLLPVQRLDDPQLVSSARELERREGVAPTPVDVEQVSTDTSAPNAEAAGFGPSRRVILWDTLLDGRFTDREVRVVIAHELGHLARRRLWKGIAWYALFAIPGAYLIARATRRRGGMRRPEAVPLGLFIFTALGLLALPAQNPGTFDYVFFENHPTLMQRIGMVKAWQKRYATSAAQSP